MAIKLHHPGYDRAVDLIEDGEVETVHINWQEEKPTQDEVVHFINAHFMDEYGLWFLGVDDKFEKSTKEHYVYPHGDLKIVQKSAILEAIKQAKAKGDHEIAKAAENLLEMLDEQD